MDDDFGWWFGGAIGAEFGRFFIKLRHQVTDPLFPAIYNLCAATTNTGKVLIESNVQRASQFMCNKVNGMTNYLKQYTRLISRSLFDNLEIIVNSIDHILSDLGPCNSKEVHDGFFKFAR